MHNGARLPSRRPASQYAAAFALALLLTACGGSTPASGVGDAPTPVVQKGFGPSQLYHPDTNPTGRVLQAGDTGIVFVGQDPNAVPISAGQGQQQVWFEIGQAHSYEFELEEEDLALLARVDIRDAGGRTLLSVDAQHHLASVTLSPGRYALNLVANPAGSGTAPLFIRFDDEYATQASQSAQAAYAAKAFTALPSASQADPEQLNQLLSIKSCKRCDLSGAKLSSMDLTGADLSGAKLTGANLNSSALLGALLTDADLSGATLQGATMNGIRLTRANLADANLDRAVMFSADLTEANLTRALLTHAQLLSAYLTRANLSGANLARANLVNANLIGANVSGASFADTVIVDMIWIDGTRCSAFCSHRLLGLN